MDTSDNVIQFPVKPPTLEEAEAWRRFVKWTQTATSADWEEKYGDKATELRSTFYQLFAAFVAKERRNQTVE